MTETYDISFDRGLACKIIGVTSAGNYMFKVNNKNTRARREIYSKLAIKTTEWPQNFDQNLWRHRNINFWANVFRYTKTVVQTKFIIVILSCDNFFHSSYTLQRNPETSSALSLNTIFWLETTWTWILTSIMFQWMSVFNWTDSYFQVSDSVFGFLNLHVFVQNQNQLF